MPKRQRKRPAPPAPYSITRESRDGPDDKVVPPKEAMRIQFGARFRQAMLAKGVRQIEVATGTKIGRDSISGYARGRVLPDHDRIEKIAKFLGVTPENLVPHYGVDQRSLDIMPAFDVKQAQQDGKLWLRINQAVTFEAFARIVEVLRQHGGIVSNS